MSKQQKGYWTNKENCIISSSNYNKINDWKKNEPSAYSAAQKYGWLEDCTSHMTKIKKYDISDCLESSKQYTTIKEWVKNEPSAYRAARKLNCVTECCLHMKKLIKNKYWTKELCIENAKKFSNISEWLRNKGGGAYCAARSNGWIDECCSHMKKRKPRGYWTKEKCIETAKLYDKIIDWIKNDGASYKSALKNEWLDECTKHMIYYNKQLKSI